MSALLSRSVRSVLTGGPEFRVRKMNSLRSFLLSPMREPFSVSLKVPQKFDYFLVLDFEATCDSPEQLKPQEIIEFPVLCLESPSMKTVSYFHQYVKSKIHPQLTPFCSEFTGILQEQLEKAKEFPQVLAEFDDWVANDFHLKSQLFGKSTKNFAFVTCGSWDLKRMLPLQCELSGIPVPDYMKQWINLKIPFAEMNKKWPQHMGEMGSHYRLDRKSVV